MVKTNLKSKLESGENIYGTCIVSTSPAWSKIVAGSGIDFVFIDTEHIPIDRNELTFMCQTYKSLQITPIVRIPEPNPFLACMAKDSGAVGVIAPYVETVKQVRDLVGATKYRPLKGRSLQEILEGKVKPSEKLLSYLNNYNTDSLSIINIESLAAIENLDHLLSVDGLDGIVIGPHDLSINTGYPEQYEHPEFEKWVREIILKTRKKGLAAGIHFPGNPKLQIKWMREGANIILHGSDMFLFGQKLAEDMKEIKTAAGAFTENINAQDLAI